MKESKLIEIVRQYFDNSGYTTYGEVQYKDRRRCDMYATLDEDTIAFEAKTSFSFKVLEQAEAWLKNANYVYIIVPTVFKRRKQRAFAIRVAKKLNIGIIEVSVRNKTINIIYTGERNNKPALPTLYNEQKDTVASNSENAYVTPFKLTVQKICDYMEDKKNEVLFSKLINNIDHHYKNNKSANGALVKLIKDGVIPGYFIIKINGKNYIKKYDI
jgi:hypothetical protein